MWNLISLFVYSCVGNNCCRRMSGGFILWISGSKHTEPYFMHKIPLSSELVLVYPLDVKPAALRASVWFCWHQYWMNCFFFIILLREWVLNHRRRVLRNIIRGKKILFWLFAFRFRGNLVQTFSIWSQRYAHTMELKSYRPISVNTFIAKTNKHCENLLNPTDLKIKKKII